MSCNLLDTYFLCIVIYMSSIIVLCTRKGLIIFQYVFQKHIEETDKMKEEHSKEVERLKEQIPEDGAYDLEEIKMELRVEHERAQLQRQDQHALELSTINSAAREQACTLEEKISNMEKEQQQLIGTIRTKYPNQ